MNILEIDAHANYFGLITAKDDYEYISAHEAELGIFMLLP